MAFELSGIENNEFYSGHYLDEVLEGDLKGLYAKWNAAEDETGIKPPFKRFADTMRAWDVARKQAAEATSAGARWEAAREVHVRLLDILGYPVTPSSEFLEDGKQIPLLCSLDQGGKPFLWVVEAPFPKEERDDPLDASLLREQYPSTVEGSAEQVIPRSEEAGQSSSPIRWRELLDRQIFQLEHAPRWILFVAGNEAILAERHKWIAGKFLRFDFAELFSRKEQKALKALCGLIHRDSLAPNEGACLHDTLEENSHKHAFAVSGDLKHGVRRAVELLANEAVWYRREKQKKGVFNEEEFAKALEKDCLTWMYRLLFLFYVEARGSELGVVPMNSDAYREGYSLERLRDLELIHLSTEAMRTGYYLDTSLRVLFRILNEGFAPQAGKKDGELSFQDGQVEEMRLESLRAPLFDDDKLEILKGVKFRNMVLQEILELLSLSGKKKKKSRGRISYAQLGINQLGAVYEGLLSYTGFFANEDLYEVAAEKDCAKLSGKPAAEREALKTYFVPAGRIGDYKEGEIVKDENERKVIHKKGAFIFRLAGRNREKSASYYTPEVLTQCLVKYALKELIWEEGEEGSLPTRKKTADEILALTICEPAMGSSAFLIEAVDQLADAYLEARQEEVKASGGETIAPEEYQREKRRVKARLATNNCYGVDLNPTAVELAKVSLWLATLHEDGKCPWFGLRLATGNSLVGARREVFKTADVTRKGTKDNPNWLGLVPEPVPLHWSQEDGEDASPPDEVDWANWTAPPRPKGTIYHFLLPAKGMAAFDKNKLIKQLAPDSVKRIKEWRKEFCKPFKKSEAERLEQSSDAVDRLFAQVVRERVLATQETSDRIPVWGEPPSVKQANLLVRDQEEVAAALEDGSSAYRRLKLAMDAWCALWFWPIEEAELLPDRATWLAQMELILKGQVTHEPTYEQGNLFAALGAEPEQAVTNNPSSRIPASGEPSAERLKRLQGLSDAFRGRRADYFDECGLADVDRVLSDDNGLRIAQELADRIRPHHWSLRFAEVFGGCGGFDLILGNPPWIKVEWDEGGLLSEFDPFSEIRRGNTPAGAERELLLADSVTASAYLKGFEETTGTRSFLNEPSNYSLLRGVQGNLYKCFLILSFGISAPSGMTGLIHQKGVYDDPNGGPLRRQLFLRLKLLFHFMNKKKLFDAIKDEKHYELSILAGSTSQEPDFQLLCNLVHPTTIDSSFAHDGRGVIPGIKDEAGQWDTRGHRERLVGVDKRRLDIVSRLYGSHDVSSEEARLPLIHSSDVWFVVERFAAQTARVGDLGVGYRSSKLWDEKFAVDDGTIRRETQRARSASEWILQGPHFYVGNPFAKTPNEICRNNLAYTAIDLEGLPSEFLPRTNYVPNVDRAEYLGRIPQHRGRAVSAHYRQVIRAFVTPIGERTLISALVPRDTAHIHSVISVCLDTPELLLFSALVSSLPYDFVIKIGVSGGLYDGTIRELPLPRLPGVTEALQFRALILNSLTSAYADLWEQSASVLGAWPFAASDVRLKDLKALPIVWAQECALRTDFERRQALLEIDVLSSMSIALSIDDLVAIYRVQFPVLQQNERARLYDRVGRIVPTSASVRGNPAVSLVELAATLKEQAGFDVHAEYHPDGLNTQELRRQKLRLGKKEADVLGVPERCTMADLLAETEVRWSDGDNPEGRSVRLVGLRYTDPGLEPRIERVYPTPWVRCDREADYRQAWVEFERRLGKKMPEETAL